MYEEILQPITNNQIKNWERELETFPKKKKRCPDGPKKCRMMLSSVSPSVNLLLCLQESSMHHLGDASQNHNEISHLFILTITKWRNTIWQLLSRTERNWNLFTVMRRKMVQSAWCFLTKLKKKHNIQQSHTLTAKPLCYSVQGSIMGLFTNSVH